jgi:hypothetical protein
VSVEYLDLVDYLAIAAEVTGMRVEQQARGMGRAAPVH